MRRLLFATLTVILFSLKALAQMPYTFTVFNQAYVPLDSATLIDSGVIWNSGFNFAAPIGFPFNIDTIPCSFFFSQAGSTCTTDTLNVTFSGFLMTDANLDDRGYTLDTVSHSPVRYKVTGPVGNRIFKFEIFNAGFDQQLQDIDSMTDSVNLQVWYYEDSDAVELRYGPSRITDTDYFSPFPFAGYVMDLDTLGNGTLFALNGNPVSPTLQTVPLVGGNPTVLFSGLTSFPPSGTVYRFAYNPVSLGVTSVTGSADVTIFPTICNNQVTVKYTGTETLNYTVLAINGTRMPITGQVINGQTSIDISALPSGMYLMQLQGDSGSKVYKFVKI